MSDAFDQMKNLREKNVLDTDTKIISYCDSTKKKYNRFANFIIILCILFIAFSLLNKKESTEIRKEESKNYTTSVPLLQVTKSIICPVDMMGTPGVCGIAKNNSNKYLKYAQIDVNLYDRQHNLIATAMANITNVPPNGTWQFMAIPLTVNIPLFSSYEIVNIYGW